MPLYPEDRMIHNHLCENLKSSNFLTFAVHVPPKCGLKFDGLHEVVSQNRKPFITQILQTSCLLQMSIQNKLNFDFCLCFLTLLLLEAFIVLRFQPDSAGTKARSTRTDMSGTNTYLSV
jgi:hypothetical protein